MKNPHPSFFGFSSAVVASGSMEPEIKVNDMVIIQRQKEYKVGDIITFRDGANVVTHRVYSVDGDVLTTKGDNNNIDDKNKLSYSDIYGKVVFIIPKVGAVLNFMKTPLGVLIFLSVGLILFNISVRINKREGKEKSKDEK